jgi:hypothetical protein
MEVADQGRHGDIAMYRISAEASPLVLLSPIQCQTRDETDMPLRTELLRTILHLRLWEQFRVQVLRQNAHVSFEVVVNHKPCRHSWPVNSPPPPFSVIELRVCAHHGCTVLWTSSQLHPGKATMWKLGLRTSALGKFVEREAISSWL